MGLRLRDSSSGTSVGTIDIATAEWVLEAWAVIHHPDRMVRAFKRRLSNGRYTEYPSTPLTKADLAQGVWMISVNHADEEIDAVGELAPGEPVGAGFIVTGEVFEGITEGSIFLESDTARNDTNIIGPLGGHTLHISAGDEALVAADERLTDVTVTTLSSSLSSSAGTTTAVVTDRSGIQIGEVLNIDDATNDPEPVYVAAFQGGTSLTVRRGIDGGATAHDNGANVIRAAAPAQLASEMVFVGHTLGAVTDRVTFWKLKGTETASAGEEASPDRVRLIERPVGWDGASDPDGSEGQPTYRSLNGATQASLGWSEANSWVELGDGGYERGRLYWEDPDGLTTPEDALLQATLRWDDGAQWAFLLGIGVNVPDTLHTGDPRGTFTSGVVIQVVTATFGETAWRLLETEEQTSHYPQSAHGSWTLNSISGVTAFSEAEVADADQRNASFKTTGSFVGGGADADDEAIHVALQVYRRNVDVFMRGVHLAHWRWAAANDPFRTGRTIRRNYLVQSISGDSYMGTDGGTIRPIQRVSAFQVTPALSDAPDPARFL